MVLNSNAKSFLELFINGKKHKIKHPEPEILLSTYLREHTNYKGTKIGCGEGGCGACTVMISHYDKENDKIINRSANGCLVPLCALDGMAVVTAEGIGSLAQGRLHQVQKALVENNASQCGFCTPGFVMSLYTELRNNPKASQRDLMSSIDGNLCRCTGYRPIIDAAKSLANVQSSGSCCRQNSESKGCSNSGFSCSCSSSECCQNSNTSSGTQNNDIEAHPIFPPSLKKYNPTMLEIHGEHCTWFRPVNLNQLMQIKKEYGKNLKMIVGNTEVGIEMKARGLQSPYNVLVGVSHIPELNKITESEKGIIVGSSVTLNRFMEFLQDFREREPIKGKTYSAFLEQLHWFAGKQIRNMASLGGNIATGSPISDLNPVFCALNCSLELLNSNNEHRFVNFKDFFKNYRVVDLAEDEVIKNIHIPYATSMEIAKAYKQARRREDDIAIVTAGMRVKFEQSENGDYIVSDIGLSYGGMWKTTVSAKKTEQFLLGKSWRRSILEEALSCIRADLPLIPGAPGGMIEYRQTLTSSFFFKFFLFVLDDLSKNNLTNESIQDDEKSVLKPYEKIIPESAQHFKKKSKGTAVGDTKKHLHAKMHVTGEAVYVDDIPKQPGELRAAFVKIDKPHARILSVHPEKALEMDGVVDYIDVNDIPGTNDIAPAATKEPLFATDEVVYSGQPIGLIIAETEQQAVMAAKLVDVDYEELDSIVSIKEAIDANSFYDTTRAVQKGDESKWNECDVIVEGEAKIGGQEHFYLEPVVCLSIQEENDEMSVWVTCQNPSKVQQIVAELLNVPLNRITAKVKRIGGGFGGKETRFVSSLGTAVAARKLRQPVRIVFDRETDVTVMGQRHPFIGKYKIGAKKNGELVALDVKLHSNAGWSQDLSLGVMERAVWHVDCCYSWKYFNVHGTMCKTNLPSHTAFRGFGAPQGMMITEMAIEHIARRLGMSPTDLRQQNLAQEGSATPYGQDLIHYHVPRLWNEVKQKSRFEERKQQIEEFNQQNRWKKRGISIMPTKFGIAFGAVFLNQGGALVHIYTDGSVLISHGGIEMGQGLHTKVAQVAANTLDIPLEDVFISNTSTDKVPNSSATAASVGSDLYGMAVLDACRTLKKRLNEVAQDMAPDSSFKEIVSKAYFDRVNLSAQGFWKMPNIWFDWETGRGHPFRYFTTGCACAEVEVDVLTGDFKSRRVDICMDVGDSLNPNVDIGQIEGAFTQGMGLFMMEELIWGDNDHPWVPRGRYFTRGPGAYKLPSADDMPSSFQIHLLSDAPNPYAVHSSKAIGEPPLFLSSALFFAAKEAITSARTDAAVDPYVHIDSPATPERTRMACADHITKPYMPPDQVFDAYRAKSSN
eukprot:gb/GECH01014017.1/.p1 GENE.gb/GECH01014017.1/~~gb/GECH01014017.1/.p1  ORF type:complete len:1345 (+),score=341.46 gb/GECH01014017.1/:1-4035(+)